ncbi:MAG: tRNA pseudouridine synthase B, partial [Gemmatimonadota bacterium]
LIVCVGRATRLAELFHLLPKRYTTEVVLGVETTTDDRTGTPLVRSDAWTGLGRRAVEQALLNLTGELSQVPPAFSAKRVAGRRAYSLARDGLAVDLAPVQVRVHSIELTGWSPPTAALDLWVSTGTYVRALARDLGRSLECGGHLAGLRRTQIGPFEVGEADATTQLEPEPGSNVRMPELVSPLEALEWLAVRTLDASEAEDVAHGRSVPEGTLEEPLPVGYPACDTRSWPVVLACGEELVAVAERRGGVLQPTKVLSAA